MSLTYPLNQFQDKQVFQLLRTFFEQNCKKAGVPAGLGKELITTIWEQKDTIDYEKLRIDSFIKLKLIFKACTVKSSEANTLNLLNLSDAKTVVDIGANKLSAVNFFGSTFPTIEKLIAIDIVPQQKEFQHPDKSQYIQVDPEATELPIQASSVDVAHIQFVLHHLQSKQYIATMLKQAHSILKPSGRLIIWEESFTDDYTDANLEMALKQGIETDPELTKQFYTLSKQQKISFILTLDWIINVGNPHMPWTGQYYSWNEWTQMIENSGFTKEREVNLGLRLNGKLKQGVHMMGEFLKS